MHHACSVLSLYQWHQSILCLPGHDGLVGECVQVKPEDWCSGPVSASNAQVVIISGRMAEDDHNAAQAPFVARAHLRRNFSFSHPGRPRRADPEGAGGGGGAAFLDLPPTPRPRLRGQGRQNYFPATPRQNRRRSWGHEVAGEGGRVSGGQAVPHLDVLDIRRDFQATIQNEDGEGVSGSGTRFRAHRFLLALRSPVFETMFFGSLVEQSNEIVVPDVTPAAFKAMLLYIYTEKVSFQDIVNVWHLWYAARKYMLEGLEDICRRHLKMRLNPKNVLDTYLYAENYGDTQMLYECLKLIDRNAQSILNSSKCSTLPLSIFKGILSRNTLAAKEVEVFESVIRWSQAEIKRRLDDEDEGEVPSLSELFKEFQPFMRFHGFTSQEFVHTVLPYGVLDIEAISKISAKIRHKEEPETFRESENTLLSPEPRTGLNQARDLLFENDEASNTLRNARVHTQNIKDQNPVQSMTRMGPGYYQCARFNPDEAFSIVNKWPDSYVLKFRADRNIYLLGACITENDRQFYKPSFHFILKLKDVSNGRVISEGTETFMRKPSRNFEKGLPKSALNSGPHDISLRNIAHIYKDKWYELCLTITLMDRDSGKVPMFMTQCKDNVSAFDVNFEFKSRHIPDDKKSMASLDEIRVIDEEESPEADEPDDGFFDSNLVPGLFSRLYFFY
ncbi:hypothetical protein TCAL_08154 [Tigriopus californicus]|uniref:BTB domain-containing protein n=1 Tax=Tigriopus californicus TaxID=6832 RepID=A0A553P218_TIGCA|nr:hypothetical protein TCAL_08154 [Tigriopus californicus]